MTANIRLYNTLTRTKEPLKPLAINPETGQPMVRMYVCGPTVYDFAHIGNARPVIVFDVLFRLLRHVYGEKNVIYTRNITDVDDKINDRAARDFPGLPLNEAIRRVTEGTNAQFQADVKALGNLEPTHQPRATEHIEGMKQIIQKLLDKGFAYVAEGGEGREVLFAVQSMPRYGQLSNRRLEEQEAGARVAVEAHKRNPGDFVLWKQSSADQPGWDASFNGVPIFGRPGWHIECSAMSMAKLLEPFGGGLACDDPVKNMFDIHGGGIDLVFPHHENEIAQSCCAFGQPGQPNPLMANIWMHNGFLQVEGQKMSKSLGNFLTIADVLKDWPGEVARLAMLRSDYKQPIDWTLEALREAEFHLDRWQKLVANVLPSVPSEEFMEALQDDLNTPKAISELHRLTRENDLPALKAGLDLLGFDLSRHQSGIRRSLQRAMATVDAKKINSLIEARLAARAAKNWAESDRIRDQLVAMGIQLMDGKDADGNPVTTWEVKR
ncbi:MAG: cysteine--tRNA ligase [Rhizobiales bacterium]|nr:cysteine--tRNA ligase [Hyphomicrobiales bacterium]